MALITRNIALLLVLVLTGESSLAQNSSAQEGYVNSSQEKKDFNSKKWNDLKENVIEESGGSYNSGSEEGSFYEYDNEGYDGKYSEYKNDDEEYSYEGVEYNEGSGTGSGNGGGGYYPKDHNEKYGEQEYHPKDKANNRPLRQRKNREHSSGGGGIGGFQYVLYFILIALLAYLIYQLLMKSSFDDKGTKVKATFEEIEPTQIPKSELELLLEKALTNSDFRAAIRIYFIFIIKDLSEKEWIRWEKKKTNFSYLIEMRGRAQYNSFNEAVSIYELVWYGNYTIEKADFNSLEPRFKSLLESLNTESN